MTRRRAWAAPLLLVALTACGSTAVPSGTPGGTESRTLADTGDGLTAPLGADPAERRDGDLPRADVPADGQPGTGSNPGSRVAGDRQQTTATTPTTTARTPGSGPGYTARELRVGFSTSNDAAEALGSVGLGATVADQEELVRVYVDHVNARGGVAGRRVVPVFYDYAATGNITTSDQAACEAWTTDTRVFAATGVRAGLNGEGDALTPCLARAGVPYLAGLGDEAKWREFFPTLYNPSALHSTREARVLVESLAAQGFFAGRPVIGVIVNNNAGDYTRAVRDGMVPALARLGLTITRQVEIQAAQSESPNAELQMFTAGVTHVLFAAPGGAAVSSFMQAAESQRRRYRYAVSTQDAPGLTVQVLAPRNQLVGTVGYGYRPGLDVDDANQPALTPAMRRCFDVYTRAGYSTASLNRAAMALVCDSLDLLQTALRDVANPDARAMSASVSGLGRSLQVAGTFRSAFGPAKHDGAGAYRFLRFEEACSCFRYAGGDRAVP